MNKKIMALAVAGALAVPGVALAQSSVTISGFVKVAVSNISIGNSAAANRGGLNTSETRMVDDGPSRIEFDMRDDIGGGLVGIAKLSLRNTIDGNSAVGGAGFGSSSGTQFIGLESKEMGTLRLGSIDQHYTLGVDTGAVYGPTSVASGLIGQIYTTLAPLTAASHNSTVMASLAGGSRTRNLIRYDSPDWNGFRVGVGYSFNTASGVEGDLSTGGRKGYSMNIAPSYTAATWRIGYSYFDDKRDAAGAGAPVGAAVAALNFLSNKLYGDVKFGDFTVGALWQNTKVTNVLMLTGASAPVSNTTAYIFSGKYQTGKNVMTAMYSRAGNDKVLAGDTGAKMWAVSYAYLFSARTSVGVGYTQLKNGALGTYSIAGDNGSIGVYGPNGYNSAGSGNFAGESARVLAATLRQSF